MNYVSHSKTKRSKQVDSGIPFSPFSRRPIRHCMGKGNEDECRTMRNEKLSQQLNSQIQFPLQQKLNQVKTFRKGHLRNGSETQRHSKFEEIRLMSPPIPPSISSKAAQSHRQSVLRSARSLGHWHYQPAIEEASMASKCGDQEIRKHYRNIANLLSNKQRILKQKNKFLKRGLHKSQLKHGELLNELRNLQSQLDEQEKLGIMALKVQEHPSRNKHHRNWSMPQIEEEDEKSEHERHRDIYHYLNQKFGQSDQNSCESTMHNNPHSVQSGLLLETPVSKQLSESNGAIFELSPDRDENPCTSRKSDSVIPHIKQLNQQLHQLMEQCSRENDPARRIRYSKDLQELAQQIRPSMGAQIQPSIVTLNTNQKGHLK